MRLAYFLAVTLTFSFLHDHAFSQEQLTTPTKAGERQKRAKAGGGRQNRAKAGGGGRRAKNKPAQMPQNGVANAHLLNAVSSDADDTTAALLQQQETKVNNNAPALLAQVNAHKLSTGPDYETAPSIAITQSGDKYIAWVRYTPDRQDEVVVMRVRGGAPESRVASWKVVSGKPGQFVRPVIAAVGETVTCFWTKTEETTLASVWYSTMKEGTWSESARLFPDLAAAHQNPEVAVSRGGQLALALQVHRGASYQIEYALRTGDSWNALTALSDASMDCWDAVAAYDSSNNLHLAWSAFDKGDYDVYHVRGSGGTVTAGNARRLSSRGDYDMHPWLAAAPDGPVWISWDAVRIGRHGYSGNSTITGANLRDGQTSGPQPKHGENARFSGIEVRVIDGETVRVPGNPRHEITAPAGFKISHRGLGKIAIGADGIPWVIYRALAQPDPVWQPNMNAGYYWELQARAFRANQWQPPVAFIESDGYLEECSVVPDARGLAVAYTSEHRRSTSPNIAYTLKKANAPAAATTSNPLEELWDHHRDFDNYIGWDGDIYLASLGKVEDAEHAPKLDALTVEAKPTDFDVDERLTHENGRHSVQTGGQTYKLYWGDTHRHSNVSRCSVGNEPTPDDLYRYGIDINLYDFLALSDHAEHTTDYYWWKQQKLVDLYNIPGTLSVLYNYEWSMRFPEGHHNAIFTTRNNFKMNSKTGSSSTMKGGWEMLSAAGMKAITVPHTSADPGMGTTWGAHDDRYQRVCEIFQACRGSYEYDGCPRQHVEAKNKAGFYWKGLEKGYKMGIICSTDHGFGCSYACTYATTNTREGIWQSIWDRRCYGSTTYGLICDVRSGNHWMGEEWSATDAPPIDVHIKSSTPIRSIEIMGRFKTLHAIGSVDKPISSTEHKFTWTDPEWSSLTGEQWYYVRVIQADDEMAWTSPMWVTKQ